MNKKALLLEPLWKNYEALNFSNTFPMKKLFNYNQRVEVNVLTSSQTSVTPKCFINHHNNLVHENYSEHKTWFLSCCCCFFKFLVELYHLWISIINKYAGEDASLLALKHLFTYSTNISSRSLWTICKRKVNILLLQRKSLRKWVTCRYFTYRACANIIIS